MFNREYLKHYTKQLAKQAAKKIVKSLSRTAGRTLLAVFSKVAIALWPLWLILILCASFFAAFYGGMPSEQHLTSVQASELDSKIQKENDYTVQKWNVADYYIVPGESETSWYQTGQVDKSQMTKVEGLFNEETGKARYKDNKGRDAKLANMWSDIYSILQYDIMQKGIYDFPFDKIEKVAQELHPYFYVKKSKVTRVRFNSKGEKETNTYTVYLLVEAKTIRGHYKYTYEWVTVHYQDGGYKKYEKLKDTITLEKWEWLENYLINYYHLKQQEKVITRMLVMNASEGFSSQKEWFDWLTQAFKGASWVSSMMVPPDLRPYFEEAEAKYGIPWWFLAAVAFLESSFDPLNENTASGCYGLMQVSAENWKVHALALGFDPVADRDNPRAQIMVGTYMLHEAGLKNISWESGDWKEQTLEVLVFYSGYRGPLAEELCREEYANKVWAYADQFRNTEVVIGDIGWPVDGTISSTYGWRVIYGKDDFHEGIDITAPQGTPVVSVSGGIAETGYDSTSGNYVRIKDGLYAYSYCHLSEVSVVDNQTVTPGQIIGAVGSTGRSTGPHLHFGIKDLNSEQWIDPLMFLK